MSHPQNGTDPAALLETVLSFRTADHLEVTWEEECEASTRFANNAITQNVSKRQVEITVKAAVGQQVGRASVTDLDAESLRGCVARAEAIARASAPDPEFLPPPGPQTYLPVSSYDEAVAAADPEARAAIVRRAIEQAAAVGLQSAGSCATTRTRQVTANSAGLFYDQPRTDAQFVMTAMSDDSSGWARCSGYRWDQLETEVTARRAVDKALAARNPREIPSGAYTVILEPHAAAGFFGWFAWTMDAMRADEGCSPFSGKEGQRLGPECLHFSTQPDHAEVPCSVAAEDGLARPRATWIENGVLKSLSYRRFWAEKTGRPFTGTPGNLIMAGGDTSQEELIGSVERGLLVTRFWYVRFVDPMKLLLTGMTRDGLYWIEDGQVRHGLKNVRFNDSPLASLARVTALGRQERLAERWLGAMMPTVRIEDFQFSSGTSF